MSPSRVYSAELGRFIQKDPLPKVQARGELGVYENSVFARELLIAEVHNKTVLYTYVKSNPIDKLDILGFEGVKLEGYFITDYHGSMEPNIDGKKIDDWFSTDDKGPTDLLATNKAVYSKGGNFIKTYITELSNSFAITHNVFSVLKKGQSKMQPSTHVGGIITFSGCCYSNQMEVSWFISSSTNMKTKIPIKRPTGGGSASFNGHEVKSGIYPRHPQLAPPQRDDGVDVVILPPNRSVEFDFSVDAEWTMWMGATSVAQSSTVYVKAKCKDIAGDYPQGWGGGFGGYV